MKFIPKNNHLLVESLETEEQDLTSSGIILPKEVKEEEQLAQAIVIESASEEYPIGTKVVFNKLQPDDLYIKVDGVLKTYWSINASDIKFIIQ